MHSRTIAWDGGIAKEFTRFLKGARLPRTSQSAFVTDVRVTLGGGISGRLLMTGLPHDWVASIEAWDF